MFDVSWSELLILGIVTLVCVGPKDLPRFMATLGKYSGMAKRQATEFRRYFDDAMRQAELDQMQQDIEAMSKDVNDKVMAAGRAIGNEVDSAKAAVSTSTPAAVAPPAVPSEALPAPDAGTPPAPAAGRPVA